MVDESEIGYLRRCIELAADALDAGDEPFGSVLVLDGETLAEDRNRTAGGDQTRHPEFALARWSAEQLTREQRTRATVYTSCEHCPMCAAAHGWVGLGRIVYAASSAQLMAWCAELGAPEPPIRVLPVHDVAPHVLVDGPADEIAHDVRTLFERFYGHDRRSA